MFSDIKWKAAQLEEDREKWEFADKLEQEEGKWQAHFPRAFGFDTDYSLFKGKCILEIGCSPYAVIHDITQAEKRVGIDPLYYSWRKLYRSGSANMVQGYGEHLPFKNGSFQCVICINTLDHTREPSLVLSEVNRVMRTDGILILSVQVWALPKLIRQILGKVDRAHPHHLSKQEVFSLFKDSGFSLDWYDIRGIPHPKSSLLKLATLKWLFLRLIGWKQFNIIARGRE